MAKWTKAVGKNSDGQTGVLETLRANYTDREMRDNHYLRLKAEGHKHVIKFTTHLDPERHPASGEPHRRDDGKIKIDSRIVYVVTWSEPAPLTVAQECKK